jgi:hypothetical protein
MSDNFQYVDMRKNLFENLAMTGLYRIFSVFFGRKLQNYFCILNCYELRQQRMFL